MELQATLPSTSSIKVALVVLYSSRFRIRVPATTACGHTPQESSSYSGATMRLALSSLIRTSFQARVRNQKTSVSKKLSN
eukprot:5843041-Amphidinium_carterae.1